jgi:hypothetical protein
MEESNWGGDCPSWIVKPQKKKKKKKIHVYAMTA